jgi:hypothetical protein
MGTPGAGGSMTQPSTGGSVSAPSSQGGTGSNDLWMREDCSKAANRTACEEAYDKCQAMAGVERSACFEVNAPKGVRG